MAAKTTKPIKPRRTALARIPEETALMLTPEENAALLDVAAETADTLEGFKQAQNRIRQIIAKWPKDHREGITFPEPKWIAITNDGRAIPYDRLPSSVTPLTAQSKSNA